MLVGTGQLRQQRLAPAIVVWNLRNAFDQYGVLFWTTPEDKRDTRGGAQRLPDKYTHSHHAARTQHPSFSTTRAERFDMQLFTGGLFEVRK